MVSVVIPAYNEGPGIAGTVHSIRQVFEQAGLAIPEIVVVDDGSIDQTASACADLNVTIVRNPVNTGYGFSLKRGIQQATHDTIIIVDGDGTYPPQAMPELLRTYAEGYDMVVGARSGPYYEQSFEKRILRLFLKVLVEYTTNSAIPDINSGLRVFSRREAQRHLSMLSNAFSFTTSITLVYLLNHKFVKYIPISYDKRVGKSKVKIVRDILRTLQYIFEIILYYNPVKLYLLFAGVLVVQMLVAGVVCHYTGSLLAQYIALSAIIALPLTLLMSMLAMQFKRYKSDTE